MTNLKYEVQRWGGVEFEILSTFVHEHWKWMPYDDRAVSEHVLIVEPKQEMISWLNRTCGCEYWRFKGLPDHRHREYQGVDIAKAGKLVRLEFYFSDKRLVPLFKLAWHGQ